MKNYLCSEEKFLKDVSTHEMTIIRDDGVNRHLRFKRPDSGSYWFDIVTWNGILVINGDMGNYMFSRIDDMFNFFRTAPNDWNYNKNGLSINPSYWSEKLLAIDNNGGNGNIKEFDKNKFREQVKEHFENYFEDDIREVKYLEEDPEAFSDHEKKVIAEKQQELEDIWSDIDSELSYCSCENEFCQAINDYSWENFERDVHYKEFYFQDFFDGQSWYNYTYHYIWCCYAISYAISYYDKQK